MQDTSKHIFCTEYSGNSAWMLSCQKNKYTDAKDIVKMIKSIFGGHLHR